LREIQRDATDPQTPITSLLLRCQLLAARLSYQPLQEWVDKELNGYGPDDDLPDYRTLGAVQVLGTTSGAFGARTENLGIPFTIIEQKHWEELFHVALRGGIGGYEHLADAKDGTVAEPWPAHYVQYYGQKPITANGQHLVSARKVIPKGAIVGMLATVRSRVLRLATDLEAVNPEAGDAVPGMNAVPHQALSRVITNVYGGAASVLAPSGNITAGDGSSLGVAGGTTAAGSNSAASTVHEQGERNWFARHPWVSGILLGIATSIIPAVYLAVWGPHLP
jgi:hypothetical protein